MESFDNEILCVDADPEVLEVIVSSVSNLVRQPPRVAKATTVLEAKQALRGNFSLRLAVVDAHMEGAEELLLLLEARKVKKVVTSPSWPSLEVSRIADALMSKPLNFMELKTHLCGV